MKKPRFTKSQIVMLMAIPWIFVITLGYYYVHKPIELAPFTALCLSGLDLTAGLLIVVLAGALGRKLLPLEDFDILERVATQTALGVLILGLFWLLLGEVHLYRQWIAWLVLIVGLAVFWRQALAWLRDLASIEKSWRAAGKLEKSLVIGVALLLLIQLALSLAPPIKWDTLVYHFELPRQYLSAGYLIFVPSNPYWGHPQIVEMLYTFAMALHRAQTATVVAWGLGVVFLAGLFGLTNNVFRQFKKENNSSAAGWVSVIGLMVGFSFRYNLGWAYTDMVAGLFGLAALSMFFKYLDEPLPSRFRWVALFASAAATVKWTNGVMLVGLLFCLPFLKKPQRPSFSLLCQACGISFLVVTPWLVKDFAATGNPIFPFLLSSAGYSSARIAAENVPVQGATVWRQLLLPFSITFTGVDSASGFSTDPGPLLLLLGLPGLIGFWKEERTKLFVVVLVPAAIAIGLFSLLFGYLLQPRLYFVLLPTVAVPVGLGWMFLIEQQAFHIRLGRILGGVIWLILGFCILQDGINFVQLNPLQAIVAPNEDADYLERGTGAYYYAVTEIQQLPSNDRVLMLWEPRNFYMPIDTQADPWLDRFETDFSEFHNASSIANHWCEQGFSNVLVYKLGEDLIRPAPGERSAVWDSYQSLLSIMVKNETIAGWYDLYSLNCAVSP